MYIHITHCRKSFTDIALSIHKNVSINRFLVRPNISFSVCKKKNTGIFFYEKRPESFSSENKLNLGLFVDDP